MEFAMGSNIPNSSSRDKGHTVSPVSILSVKPTTEPSTTSEDASHNTPAPPEAIDVAKGLLAILSRSRHNFLVLDQEFSEQEDASRAALYQSFVPVYDVGLKLQADPVAFAVFQQSKDWEN